MANVTRGVSLQELYGFRVGQRVILNRLFPPYNDVPYHQLGLEGKIGVIEKILTHSQLDFRIGVRVPGERLLVFVDPNQINHA